MNSRICLAPVAHVGESVFACGFRWSPVDSWENDSFRNLLDCSAIHGIGARFLDGHYVSSCCYSYGLAVSVLEFELSVCERVGAGRLVQADVGRSTLPSVLVEVGHDLSARSQDGRCGHAHED